MHEKLVIVPKRTSALKKVLNIVWFALACVSLLMAIIAPGIFLIPAVVFIAIWVWQTFRSNEEYEYTY